MAEKIVNQIMQQKRGTLAAWTSKNPVLKAGEIGFVTDKKMFKIGDGTTAFNSLPYQKVSLEDVVGLLDANGKFSTDLLPSLALGDTEVVANDEARFALTTAKVQKGDVVIVTGTNKTYRVIDDTKLDQEAGYAQILTPDAPVQTVNNKTGNVRHRRRRHQPIFHCGTRRSSRSNLCDEYIFAGWRNYSSHHRRYYHRRRRGNCSCWRIRKDKQCQKQQKVA